MEKITKADLRRQTNYIIVNSHSSKAYADTDKLAKLYLEKDNKNKVISTVPEDFGYSALKVKAIGSSKRNSINVVESDDKPLFQYFPEIIHYLKYGMLIVSNKNLNAGDFSLFGTSTFQKKSIDVIKHQYGLIISTPEHVMLKNAISEAKEGLKISRNFSYMVYPDTNFEFNKQKVIELKKQHELIDVFGLMLTQYAVNSEVAILQKEIFGTTSGDYDLINNEITEDYTEKYAYYVYLTRQIIGVSKTTIEAGIAYLASTITLPPELISFAKEIWLGIKRKPEITETVKIETPKPETKQSNNDDVIDKAIRASAEKLLTGEVVIMSEQDGEEFAITEYDNFCKENSSDLIDMPTYTNKVQEIVYNKLKSLGVPVDAMK